MLPLDQVRQQSVLSGYAYVRSFTEIFSRLGHLPDSRLHRARLRACAAFGSGGFLRAVPAPYAKLESPYFRFACAYRLGVAIFPTDGLCPVCQARISSAVEFHLVTCSKVLRNTRHNSLARGTADELTRVKLPVSLEQHLLDKTRPGDITIEDPANRTFLDVTVVNPCVVPNIVAASKQSLAAASIRARFKRNKYREQVRLAQVGLGLRVSFIPLAVETYGGWCKEAQEFFRSIAGRVRNSPGGMVNPEAVALDSLLCRLDIVLQRHNAAALIAQAPLGTAFAQDTLPERLALRDVLEE
jgi:hypothetical protein